MDLPRGASRLFASATKFTGRVSRAPGKMPRSDQIAQPADQASQNADGVPEQGRIGRPVNIGFYNRRIHAQLLPIFQAVIDGRSNDGVIKLLHRRGRQPVECMIESVVPGNRRTLEARKFPQRVSIINTFPKLPVIPILDAHQNQRTQNLARR